MSIQVARNIHTLVAPMVLVAATLALLAGCSKAADDYAAAAPLTSQSQAVQSSIASAQAAHNMGVPAGGALSGMARVLGQRPVTSGSNTAGGLPPARTVNDIDRDFACRAARTSCAR